jgi:hypothetical protein
MAGRKKGQRSANIIQSSDDGEAFDLNVSDTSSVGDNPVAALVRSGTSVGNNPVAPARLRSGTSNPGPQAASAEAVSKPNVAPIAPTPPGPTVLVNADEAKQLAPIPQTGSNRSSQANDTNYFYVKREIEVKEELQVRKVCRLCW